MSTRMFMEGCALNLYSLNIWHNGTISEDSYIYSSQQLGVGIFSHLTIRSQNDFWSTFPPY